MALLQRLRRGHSSGGALAALPALAMTPLQPSSSSTPALQSALASPCRRVTSEGAGEADSGTADASARANGRLAQTGRSGAVSDDVAPDPDPGPIKEGFSSLPRPSNPGAGPCSEAHAALPLPLQPPFIDLGPAEPSSLQYNGEVGKPDIGMCLGSGVAAAAPVTLTALEQLLDGFGDTFTLAGSAPASPAAPPLPAQAPGINGWASFGEALSLCYEPPAQSDSASPTASADRPLGLGNNALATGGALPDALVTSLSPVPVRFQGTLGASNGGAPGALAAGQLIAASPFEGALEAVHSGTSRPGEAVRACAPQPADADPLAALCADVLKAEVAPRSPAQHASPSWAPGLGSTGGDPPCARQPAGQPSGWTSGGLADWPGRGPLGGATLACDTGGGASRSLPRRGSLGSRERILFPVELRSPGGGSGVGFSGRAGDQPARSAPRGTGGGASHATGQSPTPPNLKPAIELFSREAAAAFTATSSGDALGAAWGEAAAALGRPAGHNPNRDPTQYPPLATPGTHAPDEALWADWAAAGQDLERNGFGAPGSRRASARGVRGTDEGLELPVAAGVVPAAMAAPGRMRAAGQAKQQVSLLDM